MRGSRKPRIKLVQPYTSTTGHEAIELAALAGLELDEWQQDVLVAALGENPDGTWASPEVAVICPRQNGKNAILEARELAGLFLLGERLIIHSAHQIDTSMEAWNRLKFLIENTPELAGRVKRMPGTHGQEGIELWDGSRARFRTRTKGGGRGFSGDLVVFDEAMIFSEASLAAIMPVVSARPNPQVWYTGSAVDQAVHSEGVVLSRVRQRALKGDDDRLTYFEWSMDYPTPSDVPAEALADLEKVAAANPALGIRISAEYVRGELPALGHRNFAVERGGIGDWPDPDAAAEVVIDSDVWARLEQPHEQLQDPVAFAFDVTPDRSSSAIAAAGLTAEGRPMVEIVHHDRGTGWVVPKLLELHIAHKPLAVACDGRGAGGGFMAELEREGVEVVGMSSSDHAQAAGGFYDAVTEGRLVHLGQHNLTAAVRGATQRPLEGAWAWNRRTSAVDISPLVAVTLALGAYRLKAAEKPKPPPRVINLAEV